LTPHIRVFGVPQTPAWFGLFFILHSDFGELSRAAFIILHFPQSPPRIHPTPITGVLRGAIPAAYPHYGTSFMSAAISAGTSMRLVREDDVPPAPATTPGADIESLQREVADLQEEIGQLKRRGDKLNFHLSRIDEELKLAARLQQDFLPKTLPQIGQIHFHTLFRPAVSCQRGFLRRAAAR